MGIIGSLIIGLLAGLLASKLMGGSSFGCIGNTVLGLIGGALGGWVLNALNIFPDDSWLGYLITGLIGAVIILYVARLLRGKK